MASFIKTATPPEHPVPKDFPFNWIVYGGSEIKKKVNIPVIVVNGIRTPEQAGFLVEKGLADFVAIGKGLLANPRWAIQAQEQQETATCLD
jgi:2,4-dienoyl-CoA reductase-like NADH-dependent reductase (Old Yellow Enzyme family)